MGARRGKKPIRLLDQSAAAGRAEANASRTGVLSNGVVLEVLQKFHRFEDDDARAAFANRWVQRCAGALNETWPILYRLLALIRDRELYRDARWLGAPADKPHGYETFEAYFEEKVKLPFARWAELEATYQFVHTYAPELESLPYPQVRAVVERAENPPPILDGPGPASAAEKLSIPDYIRNTGWGTNADYLTARIARDRPDILERMRAGEFKSVRAAALEAGIVQERISILKDPHKAAAAIKRHFSRAEVEEIARLLHGGEE